jgi:hypothetical protein
MDGPTGWKQYMSPSEGAKGGGGHKINTKPSFDLDDSDYRL